LSLQKKEIVCQQLPQQLEQLQGKAEASEVTGTLAITFIHNEPDLRIEVAAHSGLKVNIRNVSSFAQGERKEWDRHPLH
jgi:hypothetical protein